MGSHHGSVWCLRRLRFFLVRVFCASFSLTLRMSASRSEEDDIPWWDTDAWQARIDGVQSQYESKVGIEPPKSKGGSRKRELKEEEEGPEEEEEASYDQRKRMRGLKSQRDGGDGGAGAEAKQAEAGAGAEAKQASPGQRKTREGHTLPAQHTRAEEEEEEGEGGDEDRGPRFDWEGTGKVEHSIHLPRASAGSNLPQGFEELIEAKALEESAKRKARKLHESKVPLAFRDGTLVKDHIQN